MAKRPKRKYQRKLRQHRADLTRYYVTVEAAMLAMYRRGKERGFTSDDLKTLHHSTDADTRSTWCSVTLKRWREQGYVESWIPDNYQELGLRRGQPMFRFTDEALKSWNLLRE